MKRLTITYDGREIFDSDIVEFKWSESDTGITVTGSTVAKPKLGEMLSQALKNRPVDKPVNNDKAEPIEA